MSPESELCNIMMGVDRPKIDDFTSLRCLAQSILQVANEGLSGDMEDFFAYQSTREKFDSGMARSWNDDGGRIAMAVIASALAAQRGQIIRSSGAFANFVDDLPPAMQRFAIEAQDMLLSIQSRASTPAVNISLPIMKARRERMLQDKSTPELVVILGLNGCGKTTMIRAIVEFARGLGIGVGQIKSPSQSEPGKLIQATLRGTDVNVGGEALQLVFLADLFEILASLDVRLPVYVADRLAPLDGQVFSPDITKLLCLVTLAQMEVPITALVVDRHAVSCAEAVLSRPGKPRIFERDLKLMTKQQIEFWRLTGLPGVRLVNTDISDPKTEGQIFWAMYRLLLAVAMSGVWSRALVKSGAAGDKSGADSLVNEKLNAWFFEKMFDNEGNYRFGQSNRD